MYILLDTNQEESDEEKQELDETEKETVSVLESKQENEEKITDVKEVESASSEQCPDQQKTDAEGSSVDEKIIEEEEKLTGLYIFENASHDIHGNKIFYSFNKVSETMT